MIGCCIKGLELGGQGLVSKVQPDGKTSGVMGNARGLSMAVMAQNRCQYLRVA